MLTGADPPALGYFVAALIATIGIAFASSVQFLVVGLVELSAAPAAGRHQD